MALTDKLTAIADAIRKKGGTTELLTLEGMVDAISAISAGGGGPFQHVTLLSTIEASEDVSAIKIDWQTAWSDYDVIYFRPNDITLSTNDWLYVSANTQNKQKYLPKLKVIKEYSSISILKNSESRSINERLKLIFTGFSGNISFGDTKGEEITYLYLQPYNSSTLINSGSKIDVLGGYFE